jgi:hypothetical protein
MAGINNMSNTSRRLARVKMRTCPLLLAGAVLVLALCAPASAMAAEAATPAPTTAPAKIKVGVLVSKATAEGPSWLGKPYGWQHAHIATRLVDPQIELYAIVDPGTADDAGVAKTIGDEFPPDIKGRVIDGADDAALAKLDVIVSNRIVNIDERQVDAMVKAVSGGVRLLNVMGIGTVTPGYTPAVNQLNTMGDDATYAFHTQEQEVEFAPGVNEAMLGEAADKESTDEAKAKRAKTIKVKPNGIMGTLTPGTQPLMQLAAGADPVMFAQHEAPAGTTFYVMLMGNLGKGHIMLCNMYSTTPSLDKAAGGNFPRKAVMAMARIKPQ